jgi:hypothetical protein
MNSKFALCVVSLACMLSGGCAVNSDIWEANA